MCWPHINYAAKEAVVTEKGGVTRYIFLPDDCVAVLRRWQLLQNAIEGKHVFTLKGGAIRPDALGKFFRDHCHQAGFDKDANTRGWGPHSVRHYVGIDLQDKGINEIEAAGIMGHSVNTYRGYYAAQNKERLKEAAFKAARQRYADRKKVTQIDFSQAKESET